MAAHHLLLRVKILVKIKEIVQEGEMVIEKIKGRWCWNREREAAAQVARCRNQPIWFWSLLGWSQSWLYMARPCCSHIIFSYHATCLWQHSIAGIHQPFSLVISHSPFQYVINQARSVHERHYYFSLIVLLLCFMVGAACRENQWTCDSGQCIYHRYYCDGVAHCGDGSDEPDGCSK